MTEGQRIADQLKRSVHGTAWHGPSLFEILEDVTAEEAVRRPIPTAHSIAEIVRHITVWIDSAGRVLDGEDVAPEPDVEWPAGDGNWRVWLESLREAAARLQARIEAMSDDDLLNGTVRTYGREYPRYVLLHGLVQHNTYHAGQLALLKKAARA